MQTQEIELDSVKASVRTYYGQVVARSSGYGCALAGCSASGQTQRPSAAALSQTLSYSADDLRNVPKGANLGLGCGNPVSLGSLQASQTVVDLGGGTGFDAFLAAKAVVPKGFVFGVDMTADMITKARQNKAKGRYANVEFRLGEIEHLPVTEGSADVIPSNCDINLSPDRPRFFVKPSGC